LLTDLVPPRVPFKKALDLDELGKTRLSNTAIHLFNASGEIPIRSAVREMLKPESLTKRLRTDTNA
jgi:hypothetical protein